MGSRIGAVSWLVAIALAGAGIACGSTSSTPTDTCGGTGCTEDVVVPVDTLGDEGVADVPVDVPGDEVATDTPDTAGEDVPVDVPDVPQTVSRDFTFRAICGLSMGAAAMAVAGHSIARNGPDFDVIGAMGGYIDFRYMGHVVRDLFMGGFCKMEDILAHLESINDPTVPGVDCGPVKATQPYEWDWGFNQLHFNNNGGDWRREFYLDVIGSFSYAFGNMLYHNTENPLLPPGVPYEWMRDTPRGQMCTSPYVVPKHTKDAYNAEYNPNADYDLITVCDGDPHVGCKDGDPTKCGESNPDYRQLASWFDPAQPHNVPYPYLLAVDYNGNRKRDFGEPIVVNAVERYADVGLDGCANALEDGLGGCLAQARANPAGDPNGDDFDLEKNPLGTDTNYEYDEDAKTGKHEPYEDFGLDGVAGTSDYGEGDGHYTMSPGLAALLAQDIRTFFMNATDAQLRNHTWYWDGGIRDALHSVTSNMHAIARFQARGQDFRMYDDFARTANAVVPNGDIDAMSVDLSMVDFSPAKFGRNAMVRYGNPNASLPDILAGDGGHVGAGSEVFLRVTTFFGMAFNRMPDVFYSDEFGGGSTVWTSYYSEALQGRRWYVVALPPGYEDPANAERRYPVGLLLPGIGMPLDSMSATTAVFNLLQANGRLPHFITVLPDGQCARKKTDGTRVTGCVRSPAGGYDCVEDQCKGPHESCQVWHLENDAGMDQECNSGHFFVNHKTNIWGDPDAAAVMKYEDSFFEVIDEVDRTLRTKAKGTFQVPADW